MCIRTEDVDSIKKQYPITLISQSLVDFSTGLTLVEIYVIKMHHTYLQNILNGASDRMDGKREHHKTSNPW